MSTDLSGANFDHVSGRSLVFNYSNLSGAAFTNSTATYADFLSSTLAGTKFSGTTLDHADFVNTNLSVADLSGLNQQVTDTAFGQTNLTGVDFSGFQFTRVGFSGGYQPPQAAGTAPVAGAGTSFNATNFTGASFVGVQFANADVTKANFTGATFDGSNFQSGNSGSLSEGAGLVVGDVVDDYTAAAMGMSRTGEASAPSNAPAVNSAVPGSTTKTTSPSFPAAKPSIDAGSTQALKTLQAISDQLKAGAKSNSEGANDTTPAGAASLALKSLQTFEDRLKLRVVA